MRCAWLPPFDAGPVLGAPAGDGVLVAFGGAAGGTLRAPVVAAQQPPHVPGVVADPTRPPDHLGDAGQGPQVGVEPVGLRPLQQGAFHPLPVAVRQSGGAPPAARAGQPLAAALAPAGVPAAGGLPRDPKAAGDLGSGVSLLEQAGGLQAALSGGLGIQGAGGRRWGWGALGHDHRLTAREASECHPILRASVAAVVLPAFVPGIAGFLNLVAGVVAAGGSLGIVGVGVLRTRAFLGERAAGSLASLLREPDYVAGWKKLLAEETRGSYGEFVADPGYEGRLGFLYLVQTDMQRVLDLVATEQRPVVVFVDDLDRCSPSTVAQVIEAINLFLAGQFPNCIFVLAMEPEMVAAHIEVAYQALEERLRTSDYWGETGMLGWRFLDKFVQLPLSLPALDPERASRFTGSVLVGRSQPLEPDKAGSGDQAGERAAQLEQAIQQEATSIEDIPEAAARVQAEVLGAAAPTGELSPEAQAAARRALRQRLRDDDPEVRAIVDAVAPWLNGNPREIKRFVNVFRFYVLIRQGRQEAGLPVPDSLEQVAKLAVLAVRWPQLRGILGRQIGADDGDTLLVLLEAPLDELPSDAAWSVRREALAKRLADSPVPQKLQQDLLAHEDLCKCLANGPPIGAAASGFL
jgi:hypothetical protein